ncbi:MAG TPA: bifunctional diaminohydroxyphosphoribosylaminopyrimidine deaminase/5-amino-6-(5-phosphoribosylamino)uracil reductase RibD [Burkholderiales bacterium]|nr:bifunctional diaminohydroxyphosphoribosylaminopyrimidine deaminase/5-amino-6-(5-phosphoribosylamino)uracil reductase RibD [Burkholderiales bacterium]
MHAAADLEHMARALELARRGLYTTTPNPRVGCVLVKDGGVIGEGWHERAGEAHAEVRALEDANRRGEPTRGSTAYVTLEPCNHVGRTGPCTEALMAAGIAQVIVAMPDPHPAARHGAQRLREAGMRVDMGVMEQEARALNRGFISRIERGRPWVRMKAAASLDGRTALASGESQWITGPEARRDGHHWRAQACAILTGIGTVRTDDPQLTVRDVPTARQPLRIVVDRNAETPRDARVLSDHSRTLIVTAGARNPRWPAHVEVLAVPDVEGRIDLRALMRELAAREANEIHVEAGAGLNGALLQARLVDEVLLYLAPCFLGEPARGIADFGSGLASLDERIALEVDDVTRIGGDLRIIAHMKEAA